MPVSLFEHETRLEEFCIFVEGINNNTGEKNETFFSVIESHCKNVRNEFMTLAKGELNSSSLVMRCYSQVLQEAVIQLVMTEKEENCFLSSSSSYSTQQLLQVKRNLAALLTMTENFELNSSENINNLNQNQNFSPSSTKNPSPTWRQVRQILLKTARESEANQRTFINSNSSFSTTHCLQKQTAISSSATIGENFRLPGNVFDQRRSVAEVGVILSSTSQQSQSPQQQNIFHVKSILPFVGSSSLQNQINMIMEKYQAATMENQQQTLSNFIPQLAAEFRHLLGDATNLLFRVASQTPKNSPNCAFLAFLICDLSFYLAPHFISIFQHSEREKETEDDDKEKSTNLFLLFSSKNFPQHFLFSKNSSSSSSSHRWIRGGSGDLSVSACTKFEVALGCALDCLNSDLESSIGECCHKFENENHSHQPVNSPQKQQQQASATSSTFDIYSVCSEGMVQLLSTVVHPVFCVFKFFKNEGSANKIDVRAQILKTLLRLIRSYWTRKNLSRGKSDLKILIQFCKNSLEGEEKLMKIVQKVEQRFL
jgi:hypothetical protein